MKSSDRAFTLIELMVVISIIALISSILFPVFASARKRAKRTVCQSNLKHIGIGFLIYQNSYDDHFPDAIDVYTRANPEFLTSPHPPVDQIPDLVTTLLPYAGNSKPSVFLCPEDVLPYTAYGQESQIGIFESYYAWAGTSYGFWPPRYFDQTSTSTSIDPTKFRLGNDQGVWHSMFANPTLFTQTVNSLFADGHVAFTPQVVAAG